MKYNFDEIVSRAGTYSLKYAGLKGKNPVEDQETIPLTVADMDFPTANSILDALRTTVDFRMFGYTGTNCAPEYSLAVCNWWKKRFDTELNPNDILFSPGTCAAIRAAIEIFSHPGDGIIIQRPVYGHFSQDIERLQRRPVSNRLISDGCGNYTMDFEDLEKKCSNPNNRVMILCSPANPVGRVWTIEDLQKVAEITQRHSVVLISDEVHCDIVRKGVKHTPILKAVENTSNIIMMTAINKTFNLAGLACSNAVIPNPVLKQRFAEHFGQRLANPFSISALIAAYNSPDAETWLEELNAYIDGNLQFVKNFFAEKMPWLKTHIPQGAYFMWLDFSASGLTGTEIHERIYDKAKVALQDGTIHDPEGGEFFQRICVPCARSVLNEALHRISNQFIDV